MDDLSIDDYGCVQPKSFEEMKRKIDAQLSQTLGCLSQKNKRSLLTGLNQRDLLEKDSGIFLENF